MRCINAKPSADRFGTIINAAAADADQLSLPLDRYFMGTVDYLSVLSNPTLGAHFLKNRVQS